MGAETEAVRWQLQEEQQHFAWLDEHLEDVLRTLFGYKSETAAGTTSETSGLYDLLEGGGAANPPPMLPASLVLRRGIGRVGDSEPNGSESQRNWAVRRGAHYRETAGAETDRRIYSGYDV